MMNTLFFPIIVMGIALARMPIPADAQEEQQQDDNSPFFIKSSNSLTGKTLKVVIGEVIAVCCENQSETNLWNRSVLWPLQSYKIINLKNATKDIHTQ